MKVLMAFDVDQFNQLQDLVFSSDMDKESNLYLMFGFAGDLVAANLITARRYTTKPFDVSMTNNIVEQMK